VENHLTSLLEEGGAYSSKGNRMAASRIGHYLGGNPRVMKRSNEAEEGISAAVMLLLDASGSMFSSAGEPITAAREAVYAILSGMENIDGLKSAFGFFPWIDWANETDANFDWASRGVVEVKGFDDQRKISAIAGQIELAGEGGTTPTHDAMMYALGEMAGRNEDKKIVFVLTDGDSDDPKTTRDLLGELKKEGVVVVGLGIGPLANVEDFELSAKLESVHELATHLGRMLKKLI
jgi:Mg-chelatase subunit ChlD